MGPVAGHLGQEPGLAAAAQQVAYLRDGQQLGVAAGGCGAWAWHDGDGTGGNRVIDQHVDVDEQVFGWQQHDSGLCGTRVFGKRLSLAEAIR